MKKLDTILIIVLTSIMSVCTTGIVYERFVVQPFKREAVVNGHATWEVINRSTGKTKFTWKAEPNIFDALENPLGKVEEGVFHAK
jgi:hypothetical protein